ncbi:PREDICTED: uncharacterized protein LOC104601227 [Nelumbo nucifera]|uniref:Uncharacterized protein LOC104601227 n=2 Tax=Nelumbo nucifera TaxID=4432 RepID=A0A1U8ABQ6_NELNU|nr:PREDICTED: uncharacterized protein LOC104601227 [Nelumbo nucifera]DAD28443.1 TPA_asm: hypothetical protein HUJ06_029911 [Nelumbo nucifera]
MATTTVGSLFNGFIALLLLLLHLGCFVFSTTADGPSTKKRKVSPQTSTSPSPPPRLKFNSHKALSSSWSYIKRIFSFNHPNKGVDTHPTTPTLSSARSSQQLTPEPIVSAPPRKKPTLSKKETDISVDHSSFPLRNDIFPCPICGEIFHKTQLLEQHQSLKHAVSELLDGDSGKNIVQIIFKTGWDDRQKNPTIHRILKIHNSPKILARFEEHREYVKLKAARSGVRKRDERCIADGNELLRFHCSTFVCDLGQNGNSSLCTQQYCSICGIIRSGFSTKMDGTSTLSSSWRAHMALPDEIEEDFAFMNVKRAMLVCRVVAGRVGIIGRDEDIVDKDELGFDSVVGSGGGVQSRMDEDELFVFNPRAVLPCFVIVYSV